MNNESQHQKAYAILDVIAYFFVEREFSYYQANSIQRLLKFTSKS